MVLSYYKINNMQPMISLETQSFNLSVVCFNYKKANILPVN